MIDLHAHILPGVDDGAVDLATAVAMARRASTAGIAKIVATPHVNRVYDTRSTLMSSAVESLNKILERQAVPVQILSGAEVAVHRLSDMDHRELRALGLGGGPYLLIEPPLSPSAGPFEPLLDDLRDRGHMIVLAHPERCPVFQREPERLSRLIADGAVVSITAASLSGRFGKDVRRFAVSLLERGMVHNVSSDAHDLRSRPPEIARHLSTLDRHPSGIARLTSWLTEEVPAAILAGQPVGPAPPLPRSYSGARRLSLKRDRN